MTPAHGEKTDPNFQYGTTQAVVALVIIILSLASTVFSMILGQRYQPKTMPLNNNPNLNNQDESSDETDALLSDGGTIQESSVEIEDLLLPGNGTSNCGGTG